MKDFFVVLRFELMNFLKNKSFIISTLVICLLLAIGLSVPTIKDKFFSDSESNLEEGEIIPEDKFGYLDKTDGDIDFEIIKANFYGGELVQVKNLEELEDKVESGDYEAGFILESTRKYQYIIVNNEMMDFRSSLFEEALIEAYRVSEFTRLGIDYNQVHSILEANIESETRPLGKDSAKNYMYTYVLVFGLYFMIMLYGQLIATSVASEKSNRAMEVLVTSTNTSYLIFGKVIAGALAGITQFSLVLISAITAYKLNSKAWNGAIDFLFDIPGEVLVNFAIFGILGYLLYSFIYGALGALVSRTEDISASATPITIVFVAVFMIAVLGMQNTEGIILKIASFVPLSSFMAMFVRVSMGSVSSLEVAISLGLLFITTGLIGIFAAKVYRMGTLMYGNRVKLKDAIKLLISK